VNGERTVKKLRLSKAMTIPEGTTVFDACRRIAARRVEAVRLTDANALLSGSVTDKVLLRFLLVWVVWFYQASVSSFFFLFLFLKDKSTIGEVSFFLFFIFFFILPN